MVWSWLTDKLGVEPYNVIVRWSPLLPCNLWAISPRHFGDGAEKEGVSLQLCLRNLNICVVKVDAKCWLAEMTLAMTSLPLAQVFQLCLFTFLIHTCFRFTLIGVNRRGATGELVVEFKFQSHSCKLSFLYHLGSSSCRSYMGHTTSSECKVYLKLYPNGNLRILWYFLQWPMGFVDFWVMTGVI